MEGTISVGDKSKRPGMYSSYITFSDGTESPVFDDLYGLFGWMRENGVCLNESGPDGKLCPWRVTRQ